MTFSTRPEVTRNRAGAAPRRGAAALPEPVGVVLLHRGDLPVQSGFRATQGIAEGPGSANADAGVQEEGGVQVEREGRREAPLGLRSPQVRDDPAVRYVPNVPPESG